MTTIRDAEGNVVENVLEYNLEEKWYKIDNTGDDGVERKLRVFGEFEVENGKESGVEDEVEVNAEAQDSLEAENPSQNSTSPLDLLLPRDKSDESEEKE